MQIYDTIIIGKLNLEKRNWSIFDENTDNQHQNKLHEKNV